MDRLRWDSARLFYLYRFSAQSFWPAPIKSLEPWCLCLTLSATPVHQCRLRLPKSKSVRKRSGTSSHGAQHAVLLPLDPARPTHEQKGTRWVSTTASSHEKWDWDWRNRPVSALPADRVESLLTKFDEACAGGWGRSSFSPKASDQQTSATGPTTSAARTTAVWELGTISGKEGAATVVVEELAGDNSLAKGAATPQSPAGLAGSEREAGAPLAADGDVGAPGAATAGRGRRVFASEKGSKDGNDELLDEGQRESSRVLEETAHDPHVSRSSPRTGSGNASQLSMTLLSSTRTSRVYANCLLRRLKVWPARHRDSLCRFLRVIHPVLLIV